MHRLSKLAFRDGKTKITPPDVNACFELDFSRVPVVYLWLYFNQKCLRQALLAFVSVYVVCGNLSMFIWVLLSPLQFSHVQRVKTTLGSKHTPTQFS